MTTHDTAALVARLNIPWPEHEAEEVTLPAWIIELCAKAASTITTLTAENVRLTKRMTELEAAGDALAVQTRSYQRGLSGTVPLGHALNHWDSTRRVREGGKADG